jgi:multiple sugar transport system permease protein
MATITSSAPARVNNTQIGSYYGAQLRKFGAYASVTLFASLVLGLFLVPFAYSALTSVKDREQIIASANGTILPVDRVTFEYEGSSYEVFNVPMPDGTTRQLALVQPGRRSSVFIDPDDPTTRIEWEGAWRSLQPVEELSLRWGNFGEAWRQVNFPILLRNTAAIALFGVIGTLLSSICVAYAFARFPLPFKNVLFFILIATIILPSQVTLVPTYTFFSNIGWTGTWLPLIVPHFFANAYNVFLMRQYFLTLPRELDEAAMIDGANPLRILISVIIPQSWPVIVAVALFHTVYAWNDYFLPLIYLLGQPDLQPISVGIQVFNFRYGQQPHLIQATALMGLALPVIIFFAAQKVFMRGVVVTGVDK